MEKQNLGIPAALLCVAAYVLGYSSFWACLALVIVAFAFKFSLEVKKSAVQAVCLSAIFYFVSMCISGYNEIVGLTNGETANALGKVYTILRGSLGNIELVVFAVLIILAVKGGDLIFPAFTKNVE